MSAKADSPPSGPSRPQAALAGRSAFLFVVTSPPASRTPACERSTLRLLKRTEGNMGKRRRTSAESQRRSRLLIVAAGLSVGAYAAASAALRWRAAW